MNEPAFPNLGIVVNKEGMSLRDYFAVMAINALAQTALEQNHSSWDALGKHAYIIADSMLAARNKQNTK